MISSITDEKSLANQLVRGFTVLVGAGLYAPVQSLSVTTTLEANFNGMSVWEKDVWAVCDRVGLNYLEIKRNLEKNGYSGQDIYRRAFDMALDKNLSGVNKYYGENYDPDVDVTGRALGLIPSLRPQKAITTNNLETITLTSIAPASRHFIYPNLPLHPNLKPGQIASYAMHGKFDKKRGNVHELVFGQRVFSKAYGVFKKEVFYPNPESLLVPLIQQTFIYENVVIIGFDPLEKYFAAVLRLTVKIKEGLMSKGVKLPTTKVFTLLEDYRQKEEEEILKGEKDDLALKELGVTPVYYPKHKKKFFGLVPFLFQLIEELNTAREIEDKTPSDHGSVSSGSLLSYNS